LGDPNLSKEMVGFTAETSRIVFAPRGLRIDEPLAVIDRDWSNTFFDLEASRPLGNLTADALRSATGADVALNVAGMVRAGLIKGTSGVQTAYDVFLLAPIGIGVADQSAGGSLVVAYLTGQEIKNCLEFLLPGNPNLPGQYFPRPSGMRFRYDLSRPKFDAVTAIEFGDISRGYRAIDTSDTAKELYGVTCNLYLGIVLNSIPEKTNGALSLAPKTRDGAPLQSRSEALPDLQSGPYLLPPKGNIDKAEVVHASGDGASLEIKEWQAIMSYLTSLPTKNEKGVAILVMDERARENRSIDARS
jgi:5'-nucleotidase